MLYVFMLGGCYDCVCIEVYDVVFVNVVCIEDVYLQLCQDWFGVVKGLYIDGWFVVDGVDGYKVFFVEVVLVVDVLWLFFINFGGYVVCLLGEVYDYWLLVVIDIVQVCQKVKVLCDVVWFKLYIDVVLDVDDCIVIDQVGGCYVYLVLGLYKGMVLVSDYIVIG